MNANHPVLEIEKISGFQQQIDRERIHFEKIAIRRLPPDFVMSHRTIVRYDHPSSETPFPLEYAFYLLGDLDGKTIVDFGCGDGVHTVILAALGAKVIAVDVSGKSLKTTLERVRANKVERRVLLVHGDSAMIPVLDSTVDGVLCAGMLRRVDCLALARQIRRILKPGGRASFVEQVAGPPCLSWFRGLFPGIGHHVEAGPLTTDQISALSRAVGRKGRSREFMLTSRLLERLGIRQFDKSHEMDSWILQRFHFARALASPLVWEARKEA